MPPHKRRRDIEWYLGLYNKPKAVVLPERKLTGPKKKKNPHELKITEGFSNTIIHTAVFSSILDVTGVA